MKNIIYTIFASMLLVSASCKNDDDNLTPLEQLPPATQTGENKFGCLLDGEAFLPGPGANTLDCVYQFVNGGYFFALQCNNRDKLNNRITIALGTDKLEVSGGMTYDLEENLEGNAFGIYSFANNLSYTSTTQKGELTITKLDFQNNIVSGVFWYDIIDYQGNLRKIREGRFDMRFTQ